MRETKIVKIVRSVVAGTLLLAVTSMLAACGSTWEGSFITTGENGTDTVYIGSWHGPTSAVKIECSGNPKSSVKAVLTAPGGATATTVQPEGGGPAPVTIVEDGATTTISQPKVGPKWGMKPTFTMDDLIQKGTDGPQFGAWVSCEK